MVKLKTLKNSLIVLEVSDVKNSVGFAPQNVFIHHSSDTRLTPVFFDSLGLDANAVPLVAEGLYYTNLLLTGFYAILIQVFGQFCGPIIE